jgi:hypothetical protein
MKTTKTGARAGCLYWNGNELIIPLKFITHCIPVKRNSHWLQERMIIETTPPTTNANIALHFHGLLHATKTLKFLTNLILFS